MPIVFADRCARVGDPESFRTPAKRRTGRFDLVGSVLSALAIGALVLGIHEGPEQGWTAPLTVVGLARRRGRARSAFVVWELRQDAPLLDMRLFRDRGLAAGSRDACSSCSP